MPGGRSWYQVGGRNPSQELGCQVDQELGVTIGKDDRVTMVILLFYPSKVYGVRHGISVEAGYQR